MGDSDGTAIQGVASVGHFIWQDLKSTLKTFFFTFLVAAGLMGLALFVMVLLGRPDDTSAAGQFGPAGMAFMLLFCLVYAAIPALVVASLRVLWRLCGWTFLVPVILLPLCVGLAFWLFSGVLAGLGEDTLDALGKALSDMPAMPAARIGGPIGIILLPFFLIMMLPALLDLSFLGNLLLLIGALSGVFLLGALPPALLSGLMMGVAIARRAHCRFREQAG